MKKVIDKLRTEKFKERKKDILWIYLLTKKYIFQISGFMLLSFLRVGVDFIISLKIKDVIDLLLVRNTSRLIPIAVLYVVFGSLSILITMLLQRLQSMIGFKVYCQNSDEVYGKLLITNWEELSEHHTGDLISRLSNDVEEVSNCLVEWIPQILTNLIQIIAAIAVITYYDWSMLLVLIFTAPLVIFSSRIFLKKMYDSNMKKKEVSSEQITVEKESFHNIQAIKAFNLAGLFQNRMKDILQRVKYTGLQVNKYAILSWGVMYISGQIAALICLAWAIYHVYTGVITVGTMGLIAIMATYVSNSFKTLIHLLPTAMSTITSSARVRKLMEMPNEICENEQEATLLLNQSKDKGLSLVVNNITFSYKNGKKVFADANMVANPGEIVALVGPSGEGKTTLLRILLGIVGPSQGNSYISLHDEQLGCIEMKIGVSTRRLITYVPQGNTMLSGTIVDNMRLIKPDASDLEIIDSLKAACAYDFVEKLPDGINHYIGEDGKGFSEGQNQRLAIARALMSSAPIFLLDEATSALDVVTERRVLSNIIHYSTFRTCILTTHRPTVLSMCNRVYKISNMQINEISEQQINEMINDF